MAPRKTYEAHPRITEDGESELAQHDAVTRQLLFSRGVKTKDSALKFLNPNYDTDLHDPFLLTDMEKAVERVLRAIQEHEHIVIYTDYDCDGIPGGVILHDFFTALGYTNFENYIPHRHYEGYGFNAKTVEQFKERDARLIITVDCGITDHEATKVAMEAGIDVIITDHHEPSETLPLAYAVINPKRDDAYPFKGICGSGVAFKLALATLARGRARGVITLKEGMEKWWLDMVGLATIADMVPLVDENRTLATYGLQVLRKSQRPGLAHVLRKAGSNQRFLTEDDIGFTIAPRINAASRMDDPEDAFHMLRSKDEAIAGAKAMHLEKLNNERKGVVAGMVKEAKHRLENWSEMPSVIVLGNPEWRPSLVGLVANTLSETYGRPSFLWGRDGNGIIKGSCRSDGVVSTLRLMEGTPESFLHFGGHHFSGGFGVHDDRIHTLLDDLLLVHEKLGDTLMTESVTYIDSDLSLSDITGSLIRTLRSLAPYGEGNPKPLFRFREVSPESVSIFGKAKDHTKMRFISGLGPIDAIAFFKTPEQFRVVPEAGKSMTLIAHIEESYFMGRKETRMRIVDILG
jgi:single-stranded-DNA-specific exonuclease